MKRITTIAAATLLAASTLAAPALAGGLSAGVGVQADAGANTGSAGVDSGVTASTSDGADFNTILPAIGDDSSAGALRTMTDVSALTVIDVSETANADAAALDSAIKANATQIEHVREALQSNAAVNAALEAQEVDVSEVIAANVAADGSLTVFVE